MYPIDLQTILQVFANQSGELRANVKQMAKVKGECQVSIVLSMGKVVSCTILQRDRVLFSGGEAFRMLVNKGTLQWEYLPAAPATGTSRALMISPPREAERAQEAYTGYSEISGIATYAYPIQARAISAEEFATWPRLQRYLYQLSTGDKTIGEISTLLSIAPDRVKAGLLPLMRRGIVSLR